MKTGLTEGIEHKKLTCPADHLIQFYLEKLLFEAMQILSSVTRDTAAEKTIPPRESSMSEV